MLLVLRFEACGGRLFVDTVCGFYIFCDLLPLSLLSSDNLFYIFLSLKPVSLFSLSSLSLQIKEQFYIA